MRTLTKTLGTMLVALLALSLVAVEPVAAGTGEDELTFVAKVNELRAARGLRPLAPAGALFDTARAWSNQLAASGALSHNPALGQQVANWSRVAENVGTGADLETVFGAFTASSFHLGNMTDSGFDSIGVGVVAGPTGLYVTMVFVAGKAAPTAAPTASARKATTKRVCTRNRRGRVTCRVVRIAA